MQGMKGATASGAGATPGVGSANNTQSQNMTTLGNNATLNNNTNNMTINSSMMTIGGKSGFSNIASAAAAALAAANPGLPGVPLPEEKPKGTLKIYRKKAQEAIKNIEEITQLNKGQWLVNNERAD